jgi:hypothetical protein
MLRPAPRRESSSLRNPSQRARRLPNSRFARPRADSAEEQVAGFAPRDRQLAELPDEVDENGVGTALRAERSQAARAERHGELEQARYQRVRGFLQGRSFDVAEALQTKPDATVDLGDP